MRLRTKRSGKMSWTESSENPQMRIHPNNEILGDPADVPPDRKDPTSNLCVRRQCFINNSLLLKTIPKVETFTKLCARLSNELRQIRMDFYPSVFFETK